MGPVRISTVQNAMPTSAAETPSQSHLARRVNTYPKFPTKQTKNESSATMPEGAWR